jgi:hypothetical protein
MHASLVVLMQILSGADIITIAADAKVASRHESKIEESIIKGYGSGYDSEF